MKLHEPESWSTAIYFGIGAVLGLLVGVGASGILEVRVGLALAIVGGGALLGGFIAVALREHLVEISVRWY